MKNSIILIIKGFIIGIGKVIPGVSGSMLAISLGVYEKCIGMINNFFKDFYNNIIFLGNLAIGVLLAIVLGSKVISYMLNYNYFYTMILFIGLIAGTIPNILKEVQIRKKNELFYIIMPILFLLAMNFIKSDSQVVINNDFIGYLYTIFLGFIDALTMIVPGVSGTAIFVLLGVYEFILNLFSNPFSPFVIFFGIGLFLGIIIVSKIIAYLLKNFKDKCYLFILGLVVGSLIILLKNLFGYIDGILMLLKGIFLFLTGYYISKMMDS